MYIGNNFMCKKDVTLNDLAPYLLFVHRMQTTEL